MKRFTYIVSDPQGLHARNAVSLCRLAGTYQSQIDMAEPESGKPGEIRRKADCKDMIALMGLCVHQNAAVEITIEGDDEKEAFAILTAALPTIL